MERNSYQKPADKSAVVKTVQKHIIAEAKLMAGPRK